MYALPRRALYRGKHGRLVTDSLYHCLGRAIVLATSLHITCTVKTLHENIHMQVYAKLFLNPLKRLRIIHTKN